MKENTTNIKAHICMTVAIFFFAIISPVGKIVLDHIHPLTLNTLRLSGAGISVAIGLGTVDYYTVLATVLILFGVIFVNKQKI